MKYLIVLGLVLALGMLDSFYARQDEQIRLEAQHKANKMKAETKAALEHPFSGHTATVTQLGKKRFYTPTPRERNF